MAACYSHGCSLPDTSRVRFVKSLKVGSRSCTLPLSSYLPLPFHSFPYLAFLSCSGSALIQLRSSPEGPCTDRLPNGFCSIFSQNMHILALQIHGILCSNFTNSDYVLTFKFAGSLESSRCQSRILVHLEGHSNRIGILYATSDGGVKSNPYPGHRDTDFSIRTFPRDIPPD